MNGVGREEICFGMLHTTIMPSLLTLCIYFQEDSVTNSIQRHYTRLIMSLDSTEQRLVQVIQDVYVYSRLSGLRDK